MSAHPEALMEERVPGRIALMLPKFSRYGGVEQFGYRLAAALAERGHDVDFLCARQEAEAPEGVRVLTVGRIGGARFLKTAWFLWRTEKLRQKGGYDLAISLGKSLNQDLIRMGGGPLRTYWKKSEQALEKGFPRVKKRLNRLLSPVSWLILAVEKRQFASGCQVIAVSDLVREWLLAAHPSLAPENVSVVYNSPDLSRFCPPVSRKEKLEIQKSIWDTCCAKAHLNSPFGREDGKEPIFLGTASTNFVLKGVAPLIRSLPLLPAHTHLFVAGGRNAGVYVELAEKLGVADRVHFSGKVEDMPAFYRALDVFVLPTFYDACSNAVLEALASGCKTISSKDNGSSFFLPAESILQNPGDHKEIAAKIQNQLDTNVEGGFSWPSDVLCGVDTFVLEVEAALATKKSESNV